MNELLKATKAVIDAEDIPTRCNAISKLRAAVEQAEKQDAVGFEEWFWREQEAETFVNTARYGFDGGVQAERERIKDLLRQSDDWFEDEQMEQAKWLLEKIDATNG